MDKGTLSAYIKEILKEKKVKEGTCGYGVKGKLGKKPAGSHLLRKKDLEEEFETPNEIGDEERANSGVEESVNKLNYIGKGLTGKDIDTLNRLADDVSDDLSEIVGWNDWVKMKDIDKTDHINDIIFASDKHKKDKTLNILLKKKPNAVVSYIIDSLSESISVNEETPITRKTKMLKYLNSIEIDGAKNQVKKILRTKQRGKGMWDVWVRLIDGTQLQTNVYDSHIGEPVNEGLTPETVAKAEQIKKDPERTTPKSSRELF